MRHRLLGIALAVCCSGLGGLVFVSAPALAAAPEAPARPTVQSPVGATRVVVRGVLDPVGEGHPGTYEFLYERGSVSCEGGGVAPGSPGVMLGYEAEEVSQELTGLEADTQYTVCLRAETKGGSTVGPVEHFTTAPALETPEVTKAEVLNSTTVKLQGVLNPGAAGEAGSYEFLYNDSSPGECQGGGSSGGEAAAGGKQEVVPAAGPIEVSGLTPNAHYSVCLLARNGAGETALGAPVSFTTPRVPPVIEVGSGSFSQVTANSALVGGVVNMRNAEGGYFYTYGTTSQFEHKTAHSTTETSILTSNQPVVVPAELAGLQANTEYHFMLVVTNEFGEVAFGEMVTFHTLPLEASGLPDGRTFEMVTPVENHDAEVHVPAAIHSESLNEGLQTQLPFQVAADGNAIAYLADPTVGGYGVSGSSRGNQYLANRLPNGGWVQADVQPDARAATYYQGFSSNLTTGILGSGTEAEPRLPPLSAQAPGEGYPVLYACDLSESPCTTSEESAVSHSDPYQPLFGKPLNRTAGEFGTVGYGAPEYGVVFDGISEKVPVFAGVSETGALLFEANDALIAGEGSLEKELEADVKREISKEEDTNYLYDSVGGRLSLVDVLPNGEVAGNATFGARPFGGNEAATNSDPPDFSDVISAEGRLVFWTDLTTGIVYVREDGTRTVQVSEGAARYWTSGEDGRFVFYTEAREGKGEALYRFNMVSDEREVLTKASARVLGVVGASEDGEYVYFVADGALAPGAREQTCEALSSEEQEGAIPRSLTKGCNLYLLHDGETQLIATLSSNDGNRIEPFNRTDFELEDGDWQPGLGNRTAEVTGSGGSVVFMSEMPLAVVGYPHGYPNPNHFDEVYMFSAAANQLFCVSCGSSGEAPPASANGAAAFLPVSWSDTYLPRWISADGDRVFFDSAVPLVPGDTNGRQDVYEWELEGTGSCTAGTGADGGCVYLLSGGASDSASWFIGADQMGNNAFIATRAQLVPEDEYENFELYDARVGGVKPTSAAACTGTGCQGVPAPPPTFATPPSGTFEGVGDFPPPAPVKPAVKPKTKTAKCPKGKKRNKHKQCVKVKTKGKKARRVGGERGTRS